MFPSELTHTPMPMDHELLLIGLTLLFIIRHQTTHQRSINLSSRNNCRFDIARGVQWIFGINPDMENLQR